MANGDGSIISKGKDKKGVSVWEVIVNFGRNPVTGKYERVSKTVHGTKAEARKLRDELRTQHEMGVSASGAKTTFKDFSDTWIQERIKEGKVGRTTIDDNKTIIKTVSRYIGKMKLCDITPKVLSDTFSLIRDESEKPKSGYRMKKYYICVHQILEQAYIYDLIPRNPCDRLKAPQTEESDRKSLSASETTKLITMLDTEEASAYEKLESSEGRALKYRADKCSRRTYGIDDISRCMAVRIGVATGMRRGEILGLSWKDIDLESGVIHVCCSLTNHGEIKTPKTKSGIRTISIDDETVKHLSTWHEKQAEYLEDVGSGQTEDTPVICSSIGGYTNTSNFSAWWKKFRNRIGFHDLKFHELRHTQATQLLARGVDVKTVQTRMGHASASITMDWYAHAVPENDRKAAEIIGSLNKAAQLKVV
jgi:integrase